MNEPSAGAALLILRILLAAGLYAFIGWALLLLWRDLKQQVALASIQQAPAITLHGSDTVGVFQFNKLEVLIGRDPGHDVAINDKTVSTQHARLSYHHTHWWIEDLESTNGTFLNQEPVTSPVVVVSGDEIRCGQVEFKVNIAGEQKGSE